MFSSHIPFMLDKKRVALLCHLAIANPQWQEIENHEVLVTFQAGHVYGSGRIIGSQAELTTVVERLTEADESVRPNPWLSDFKAQMLNAIVGMEIEIQKLQCKHKLSQNRSVSERQRITEALLAEDSAPLSKVMKNLPS